jgi:hypothetical protein
MFDIPTHDPPLAPRDEMVFLLHTGAEIEHALLVQYLYAAYSLKSHKEVPPEHAKKVRAWKRTLLDIAREEMGHLISVQNLLRLVGGTINLEREDYPFRSQLYPFPFRLEPLSKASLSRYVVAEMPYVPDPPDEIKEIVALATGGGGTQVNQVGEIYARVMQLLTAPQPGGEPCLVDEDFVADPSARQARYDTWGGAASVLVPDILNRDQALAAVAELAEQGEGVEDAVEAPSHYQRLLAIYREMPEPGEWEPAYRVPVDPDTGPSAGVTDEPEHGRITHPRALKWAKLFNLRYRLLLAYLAHFLMTDGTLLDDNADYTPRGLLNKLTFDEMRHLSEVAGKLVTLPRLEGEPEPGLPIREPDRAGPPFELPYTLNLPDLERDRWRTHLDVLGTALALEESIAAEHPEDALLQSLIRRDRETQRLARAGMLGERLTYAERGFGKVVRLLEESVRGFSIGVHRNFWRGVTRDEFVAMKVFDLPLIATRPDGSFDAAGSNLIKALRGEPPFDAPSDGAHDPSRFPRMPFDHPPMAPEAIEYIYRWIEMGCPEEVPSGQAALTEEK